MTKKILLILTLTLIVSTLSMLSGCRSKEEVEDGIFVPASEEYFVLDEGEKDDSGNATKKTGGSNTNARKASSKDEESVQDSDKQSGTTSTPGETKKPSQTSNSGNGNIFGGAEDETPFVPADGAGTGSGKSAGSATDGGIE